MLALHAAAGCAATAACMATPASTAPAAQPSVPTPASSTSTSRFQSPAPAPSPSPSPSPSPQQTTPAQADHARNLAATCTACHGPLAGPPSDPQGDADLPLAGRPAAALLARLRAYRDGTLAGTLMPQLVKGYTDAELADIAAVFAAAPPTLQPTPAP